MTTITVNRNGAHTNMEIARELKKHPAFRLTPMSEVIRTLRSYQKSDDVIITECFITLVHYC